MKKVFTTCAILFGVTLGAIAGEAPKEEAAVLVTLMDATQNNDVGKFESVCDEAMKTAMTPEVLEKVSGQVAQFLKAGYEKSYMGVLDRGVVKTHYWKIDYKTEGVPDMLAELSTKSGKAAGFFLR